MTIEAVDSVSQLPLRGARVVMHPYRAVTNEHGVAELRVAKGTYKLFVSQPRYVTYGLAMAVDRDVTAKVQLDLEPIPERD
jgi:hypothetical protein